MKKQNSVQLKRKNAKSIASNRLIREKKRGSIRNKSPLIDNVFKRGEKGRNVKGGKSIIHFQEGKNTQWPPERGALNCKN